MNRLLQRQEFLVLMLYFVLSCYGQSNPNISQNIILTGDTLVTEYLGKIQKGILEVKEDVDLHGGIYVIPENITLDLRHGSVSNGCLVGCQTKLLCKNGMFNKVIIRGTWLVPVIKTSFFKDLNYSNSLQDVLNLTNSEVANKVILSPDDYYVSVDKNGSSALVVSSNTTLEVNGTIHLIPNEHRINYIVLVKGNNITIKGKGKIIGDKATHLGKSGEWGMGINIDSSSNVRITGMTVKDCWGDCIYVGGDSQNILIDHCVLDNGRRQGISITSGSDISVKNCKIENVSGTAPQYGIDVEPNMNNTCENILIEQIKINNCKGGIQVFGRATGAHIGVITIRKCKMKNMTYVPLRVEMCEKLVFEDNEIRKYNSDNYKLYKDIGSIIERQNRIKR